MHFSHVSVMSKTTRSARLCVLSATILAASLITSGCGSPLRPVLTEAQLRERAAADEAESTAVFNDAIDHLIARAGREWADGQTPVIHFLAISGGGDKGAFGAGFLVGWGQTRDPRWRRPDFDAVTGVSTGALLAPFAIIGTDDAVQQVETFYRNPKKDWVKKRGVFFFLPYKESFVTIPGLECDIRAALDAPFVSSLAQHSRAGKLLVVSATDLDLGRQKYWNLGAEAEAANDHGDRDRLQRMLLASSAIPGAFPPVTIGDSFYADGGITANVFLRLDPDNPHGFIQQWRKAHPNTPLPKMRYWVIVNNQMAHPSQTVQPRWPAIVDPSLAVSVRSATISELRWLASEADYTNAVFGADVEVRVVAIPNDWRPPVEGDFKKETMDALCDLGRTMGADPTSWTVWAAPKRTSAAAAASE